MKNNNAIVAVLVLVVIVLVGWFTYKQGYFQGTKDNEKDVEFNLPDMWFKESPKP